MPASHWWWNSANGNVLEFNHIDSKDPHCASCGNKSRRDPDDNSVIWCTNLTNKHKAALCNTCRKLISAGKTHNIIQTCNSFKNTVGSNEDSLVQIKKCKRKLSSLQLQQKYFILIVHKIFLNLIL